MDITSLPIELYTIILNNLSYSDMISLSKTNKTFKNIINISQKYVVLDQVICAKNMSKDIIRKLVQTYPNIKLSVYDLETYHNFKSNVHALYIYDKEITQLTNINNIDTLVLSNAKNLQSLTKISNIKRLFVFACNELTSVSDLRNINECQFNYCFNFINFNNINNINSMQIHYV